MQSEKGGNGKGGPHKQPIGEPKHNSSVDESESSSMIINEVNDEISLLNKLQYPENDNDSQQEQLAAVLTNNNTSAANNNNVSNRPGAYYMSGPNFDTTERDDVVGERGDSNQNNPTAADSILSSGVAPSNRTSLVDAPIPSLEATLIPDAIVQNDTKDRNRFYMATLVDGDSTNTNSPKQQQIDNDMRCPPLTQLKRETSLDRKEVLSERIVKAAQQSSSSSRTSSKLVSSLTQLKLSNMKLHGREEDMKSLRTKLVDLKKAKEVWNDENLVVDQFTTRRMVRRTSALLDNEQSSSKKLPELILISGISGTGKSALVVKGIKEPATKLGITFVSGKFDLNHSSMPLSAFVTAMAQLTRIVISGDMIHNIQADINDTYNKEDSVLLIRALPGCEELFPLYNNLEDECENDDKEMASKYQYKTLSLVGKEAIARLQYAIRGLLRIMCIHLNGVVLFIDDLQWSDTATLDLLQSISLDSDIPSLLIVGAYRQDEVPETHPLALQIREKEQTGIDLTSIDIGNLMLENVTSLIAEALDMDDDAVKNLATIVHKKTSGNAFFVLMFLRSLHDEELLTYNFSIMKWTWDDDTVNAKLATENVATVLVNKLRRLNARTQNVVKVASCLGAKFSLSAVAAITDNVRQSELMRISSTEQSAPLTEDDDDNTTSALSSSLHELQGEGLWEVDSGDSDICHFVHDKIQSAAFELIPLSTRDTFRREIGNMLLDKLDDNALEANLFEVVSLQNCAMNTLSNDKERKKLAKMNLRAGMKASENTAFDLAAVYFKAGRELLGSNGWGIDQQTMLKLCSEGANSSLLCGDLITMNNLIDEVLSQDIPVADKFNVSMVKVLAAYGAGEFNEAINIAFDFRRQLGLPTLKNKPAHPFTVIKEFMKTNHAVGKRTAEEIANMPPVTDDRIIMGQKMLELSANSCYQVQPSIFPLICCLLARGSLKHGIDTTSSAAFGGFGVILIAFGKVKEARKMVQVVEKIVAKPGMDGGKARAVVICEGMINHWTMPLQGTLAPLLEGYLAGLRSGDVENSGNDLLHRVCNLFYTGRPLEGVEYEYTTIIEALRQLNQTQPELFCETYLYVVKKLRGTDIIENEFDMNGKIEVAVETNNVTLGAVTNMALIEVSVFFHEWEDAISLLAQTGDLRKVFVAEFINIRFTFFEGLISIQAARAATTRREKRKWRKKAAKSMKMIRGLVKKGNPNVVHYLHLLVAELAALDGNNDKLAEEKYKLALAVSSTNGLVQDKALSHELTSAYFGTIGDNYWRDYHIGRCKECYLEWGATALGNSIQIT